jgi:hypothetical protein
MMDQEMTEEDPFSPGQVFHQLPLDLVRLRLPREAEPSGDPLDMGVHDNAFGLTERDSQHDVGCLSSDSRQPEQGLHVLGNLAAVFAVDDRGGLPDVFRLVAKEPGRVDQFLEVFRFRAREGPSRPVAPEKRRRHHVDALVRALRRKDGRDEELERVPEP